MIIEEIETMAVPKLKKIICDVCKEEFDAEKDDMEIEEMVMIDTVCGYESIFGDGNSVQLEMCQHCFKSILGKFVRITKSEDIQEEGEEYEQ